MRPSARPPLLAARTSSAIRALALAAAAGLATAACDAAPSARPADPFGVGPKLVVRKKPLGPTLFSVPTSAPDAQISPLAEPTLLTPGPAPEESDEDETAAAACPEGMILVSGNACSDARQTCLSWLDTDSGEVPKRCATFSTNIVCTGERQPMTFCIDRWEYAKTAREPPVSNVSWTMAKDQCRSLGKRLCTEAEWVFACEGEDMLPYPTGYTREADKCHFDQTDLLDRKGKMRDLRRPGRDLPACASPFGVMNMVGNVDEWTLREKAWTPWRASLKGGWWLAGRNRCRPATTGHDEYYFDLQTGFRCCMQAVASP